MAMHWDDEHLLDSLSVEQLVHAQSQIDMALQRKHQNGACNHPVTCLIVLVAL